MSVEFMGPAMMNRPFALGCIIVALPMSLAAQKILEIPTYKDGDTSLWYQWRMADVERIGSDDLIHSTDSFHLRFWTENAVVSIIRNPGRTTGELSYITHPSNDDEDYSRQIEPKYFHSTTAIDPGLCDSVLNAFTVLGLHRLMAQDSIDGWRSGYDGEVFVIEVSTPTHYYFHDYWTPSFFPELAEAKSLQSFADNVEELLQLDDGFHQFIDTLPKGCYRAGEITTICTKHRR